MKFREVRAGVQYNDFMGHVACDVSDHKNLGQLLRREKLISDAENVFSFRIASNCVSDKDVGYVSLVAYVSHQAFDEGVTDLRAIEVQISPAEALSFFKRFDLLAVRKGLDLSEATVVGP